MKYKIKKTVAALLLSSGLVGALAGATACGAKTEVTERPTNVDITRLAPPEDGSLPTAHTAAENLAYVAYVLDGQPQYHCYTDTVTNAAIATQYTYSYKDYRNGVTISSDITYSSMVKSATQACFVNGADGGEVYMRQVTNPGKVTQSTTNLNADWSTDAPVYYNEQAYLYTYGLFQTELSNYIINENTITDSKAVTVNSDGTYTLDVTLDPAASTYYYQYGMKTRGNLGGYPEYQSVQLSVTFDGAWRVTSLDVYEVSMVNKGVTVKSISNSHAEYFYDDAHFDGAHFAYYDSYFKGYVGDKTLEQGGNVPDQELVLDVTNILSNGFSKIMDGGQQFEISMTLGDGNTYAGYVFVALDLSDPLGTLDIKLSLGKTLQEQGLYVEYADGKATAVYGDDFALQVNMATLAPVIDEFTQWADRLNSSVAALAAPSEEDGGDALGQLMDAMVLTADGNTATLALKTDDLMGYGIGVDVQMFFGIDKKTAVFRGLSLNSLSYGGEKIKLAVNLATTTSDFSDRDYSSLDNDLADYAADAYKLLTSDLLKVQLSVKDSDVVKITALKGWDIGATAYVGLDGVTVGADVSVAYTRGNDSISAKVSAYTAINAATKSADIILTLTQLNGVDTHVQVSCNTADLSDALASLFELAGLQLQPFASDGVDATLVSVVNNVLNADLSAIVTRLSSKNTQLGVDVNIDGLLGIFGLDAGVQLGTCRLDYAQGGKNGGSLAVSLPAVGLNVSVSGADGAIDIPDTSGCLNLTELVNTVNAAYAQVNEIIEAQKLGFEIGQASVTLDGVTATVAGCGEVSWKENERTVALDLTATLQDGGSDSARVQLMYNADAQDRPLLRLAVNGVAMDIYANDLAGITSQIGAISSAIPAGMELGDEEQLYSLLFGILSGTDWVRILNELTLTTDGKSVAVEYLGEHAAQIKVGTDGVLSLEAGASADNIQVVANAKFTAGDNFAAVLNEEIAALNPASTAEGDSFIKVVYDYLFQSFNNLSLSHLLGDGSYELSLSLNGDNSSIEALQGVAVNADVTVSAGEKGNAVQTCAWIKVNGFEIYVVATVIGNGIYVEVPEIKGVTIEHLKLKTTGDSLYSLAEDLVNTLVNSGILAEDPAAQTGESTEQEAKQTLTDLLARLIEFDFDSAVKCGEKSVVIDLDNLTSQLGVQTDSALGSVSAKVDGGFTLGYSTWIELSGRKSDKQIDINEETYLDFSKVTAINLADIITVLQSEYLAVGVDLNYDDIALDGQIYVNPFADNVTVGAQLNVGYTYKDSKLTAQLSAYVDAESGDIYLSLTSVNGVATDINVYCNANELSEAVKALLQTAGIQTGIELPEVPQDMVAQLLSLDFPNLFSELYSNREGLGFNLDADELLQELGLTENANIGSVAFTFENQVFTCKVANYGLTVTVRGAESSPVAAPANALNLTELVNTVNAAYAQVNEIIEAQKLGFEIEQASVTLDGVTATVAGRGEVSWKENERTVALDLTATLQDGGSDSARVQLMYNADAQDRPLLRLAVNGVAMDIYANDLAGITSQIGAISSAIPAGMELGDEEQLYSLLFGILSGTDWVRILNELTLTTDGKSVAMEYLGEHAAQIKVGTDGVLSLEAGASAENIQVVANAKFTAGDNFAAVLNEEIAALNPASTAEGDSFIKVVYDYLFQSFNNLSLSHLLGDGSYELSLSLNGDNSSIEALQGVAVNADVTVSAGEKGNAVQTCAWIKVNGFEIYVVATVIGNGIYVEVPEIKGVTIEHLKLKTTGDSLYSLAEDLVNTLVNSGILATDSAAQTGESTEQEAKQTLTDLLARLIEFDFDSAVKCGEKSVVIDLDNLTSQLGVQTDSALGSVSAKVDGGFTLGYSTWIELSGRKSDKQIDINEETYLDFSKVTAINLADIITVLQSEYLAVGVNLDYDGIALGGQIYVNPFADNVTVGAQLSVGYTYKDSKLTAQLSAYVDAESGDIYLSLTSVNGVATDINVYCNANELSEAVKALLQTAGIQAGIELPEVPQDMVAQLLSLDFPNLFSELYSNREGLGFNLDADELLKELGLTENAGIGSVAFTFENQVFTCKVANYGLTVTVRGAESSPVAAPANALNLTELVDTVNAAYAQVNEIIASQSLAFVLEQGKTVIRIDGITAGVSGSGEICWAEGNESVALDLVLTLGDALYGTDATAIKLVYNKNAQGDPLVTLAVNQVALEIYEDDIQAVTGQFQTLYTSICTALGINPDDSGVDVTPDGGQTPISPETSSDDFIAAILAQFAKGDWVERLNDLTLSTDGKSLTLKSLSDEATGITLTADGSLGLIYGVGKDDFFAGADVMVTSSQGALAQRILRDIHGGDYRLSSSKNENSPSFIRLAYDYLFDTLESMSIEHILGANTYSIDFLLDGNACAIPALQNIYIKARIDVAGEENSAGKLAALDIDILIDGVSVKASAAIENIDEENTFYLNLNKVVNVQLPDLKVKTDETHLYATLEMLVGALNNTDILQRIMGMISTASGEESQDEPAAPMDEATQVALTDVLYKLLTLDFGNVFDIVRSTANANVTVATIDIDSLLNGLGVAPAYSVGTVVAEIDHSTHAMFSSLTAKDGESAWLSLSSQKSDGVCIELEREEYIDVTFLPTLIDDLVKSATNDRGEMYDAFTFTGDISVSLVGMIDLTISNATLTFGFTKDNDFYFSFKGDLGGSSLITSRAIGMTYQNGYITLARDMNKDSADYWVMTPAYFVDHIFDKGENSTINWLIGANGFLINWNTVISMLPADIKNLDSGLSKSQTLYLYRADDNAPEQEVSIYDYIDALQVILGGQISAFIKHTNDISPLENKLGVSDNYYGADLNPALFTDGVLTELYAAILHNPEGGIQGVKAYGAIDSYVTFLANLTYQEGSVDVAESYYDKVADKFNAALENQTYESVVGKYDEVFGAYKWSADSVEKTQAGYHYTVTVHRLDGSTDIFPLIYGSTVYVYDDLYPVYSDNGLRIVYLDENGELVPSEFTVEGDVDLYEQERTPATVTVYNNGVEFVQLHCFVGEPMPTGITGYTTLELQPTADTVTGDCAIYGLFAQSTVVINDVTYVFDGSARAYTVTGPAAGYNDRYCTKGQTLVLESMIDIFPVTSIADGAFANDSDKCLKNVVVPATITYIGEKAFANNYGMQSAVFLADSVTFAGSDSDGTYAFYGCSSSSDDSKNTQLSIYYKNATCGDGGMYWTHFYTEGIVKYYYYIGNDPNTSEWINYHVNGGGTLYGNGQWFYVVLDLQNATEYGEFDSLVTARISEGVVTTNYDVGQIQAEIQNVIDNQTAADLACVGKYVVTVKKEVNAFGATVITASLEDGNPKYRLTVDRGVGDVQLDGDYVEFNGAIYACGQVSVTAATVAGYAFDGFTINGSVIADGNTATFTADAPVSIGLRYSVKVDIFKVYSAIAFNYGQQSLPAGQSEIEVVGGLGVLDVSAEGYVFLGWAKRNGDGTLEFAELNDTEAEYYAVWGVSSQGADFAAEVSKSGVLPATPAGFDSNWYTDQTFETVVNEISTDKTVLYARHSYVVTYTINYKVSGLGASAKCIVNNEEHTGSSYNISIDILEGQTINATLKDSNKTCEIYIDNELKYIVKIQSKTLMSKYSDQAMSTDVQEYVINAPASFEINKA